MSHPAASLIHVDEVGQTQSTEALHCVRETSEKKVAASRQVLATKLHDAQGLRELAAKLRQSVLDNLTTYLLEAESKLVANGIKVHWAVDGAEACRLVTEICSQVDANLISKSKSMVTEEIGLNPFLEAAGFSPIETDLGEFIVQLDHDHPSHIVTPIIHMNRQKVARIFEREGLGPFTEDPEALTAQARAHLRRVFREACVGITGCNFIIAESGRIVTVSNEGNLRFSANAPRVQIILAGIEKIVARDEHMAVFLNLLARSATSQDLTVYTQFLASPRASDELDGPESIHLIFLDNGRTHILGGKYREILRCIRCGACLNVCPVYRNVTGHAYGSVYSGPMGSILSPLLGPAEERRKFANLPKASSLCGACEEACPVAIPIPRMLLSLRADYKDLAPALPGTPHFGPWAWLATQPVMWKIAMTFGRLVGWSFLRYSSSAPFRSWLGSRELPAWPRESFRKAWKKRKSVPG